MTFLYSNISQSSVATFVNCGGTFITNLLLSALIKIFENRSPFGDVTGKRITVPFFLDMVYTTTDKEKDVTVNT